MAGRDSAGLLTGVRYPRVASFKTAAAFRHHLSSSGIPLELDDELSVPGDSPLARPLHADRLHVGNRFAVLPMEGWDGTGDGRPTDLTERRWRHFGESGAKLVWGGEAVAVRPDGRANPRQLMLSNETAGAIERLRLGLVRAHVDRFGAGADRDLVVGLQLTHSGRFAKWRAQDAPGPLGAYAHPFLDARFHDGVPILSDDDLDRLVEDFVRAAAVAWNLGFQFVDLKHCHGYLGHELLSARSRGGRYGGSLENRTRFLRNVVEGIRASVPDLAMGVRLSAFDTVPYRPGANGTGEPVVSPDQPYPYAFGRLDDDDLDGTLADARAFLEIVARMGVRWICVTGGSPYYCPHIQRPALFPPSDGYEPPEDPLRGAARMLETTARLKTAFPDLVFVGTGYSYLQDWLPHVAQHEVRRDRTDIVGLGRMILSYPHFAADVLAGSPLRRGMICRTFSDCTTGPRNALVSGCYPLDKFYGGHPDAVRLKAVKTTAEDAEKRDSEIPGAPETRAAGAPDL